MSDYESFRTDVSRAIVLPDGGVRPPLNDPVYGFADAIGMEAARGLIADGLSEAIRRGVELGATPPEHSLLVTWEGQKGAIENTTWPGGGRTHGRQDGRSPRSSQWRCHTSGPGFGPFSGSRWGLARDGLLQEDRARCPCRAAAWGLGAAGVSSSGPFQWRGGGSRVGEDCRLRRVAPAANKKLPHAAMAQPGRRHRMHGCSRSRLSVRGSAAELSPQQSLHWSRSR